MAAASLPLDVGLIIFDHLEAIYNVLDDIDADSLPSPTCMCPWHSPVFRQITSIGCGYRPPYYLKIRKAVNDTELVDWQLTATYGR
ncbi:uncharacterized protein EKO05_0004966 [Ascochyta rabiei]|uniref:Uncharacterized protein n=1 Tax=Didymella rabiei TaxID=5454 RepID=A0A163KIF3_DIDRA|nr:uncharacterized protein EKO05_0004966 [Ascochyta rabiei]KZM27023.1 hypothetical protein ST47_g1841 [Ascochyta rabiei]UPX14486.1 hypothetical protein EKO05_0004966 [Ascochyta rabiei]